MKGRSLPFLVWGVLACIPGLPATGQVPAVSGGGEGTRLEWWTGTGARAWSATLDEEEVTGFSPLEAPHWFRPAPDLELSGFDGRVRRLRADPGRVLVLDFWATWCQPCLRQLPMMQRLLDGDASGTLEVLAVNMKETPGTAVPFAESLDLRLPLVMYSPEMERSFQVRRLPTTVVIDRWNRIRARYDGFQPDTEEKIHPLVRELVEETTPPGEDVAEVFVGRDLFDVQWSRDFPANVTAIAPAEPAGGTPGIMIVAGREIFVLRGDGRIIRRHKGAPGVGRLLSGDLDGDGRPEAVGFRPGAARLVILDPTAGEHRSWEAGAPVIDAGMKPARSPESPGQLLLVTAEGLQRYNGDGESLGAPVRMEGTPSLVVADWNGELGPVFLEPGGLRWFDSEGNLSERMKVSEESRAIVAAGDRVAGIGVVTGPVLGRAVGDWLPGEGPQLALATPGRLALIDPGSGSVRFRARWPGITGVCATDLDANGRSELAVASGRRTTLLRPVDADRPAGTR